MGMGGSPLCCLGILRVRQVLNQTAGSHKEMVGRVLRGTCESVFHHRWDSGNDICSWPGVRHV